MPFGMRAVGVALAVASTQLVGLAEARAQDCDQDVSSSFDVDARHSKWRSRGRKGWELTCNYRRVKNGKGGIELTITYLCPPATDDTWRQRTARQRDDEVARGDDFVLNRKRGKVRGHAGSFKVSEKLQLRIDGNTLATIDVMTDPFEGDLRDHADDFRSTARAVGLVNRPTADELGCPVGAAVAVRVGGDDAGVTADAGPDAGPADAAPPEVCRVRGVARDHLGAPIAGAEVRLVYGKLTQDVATGADGAYAFEPIGEPVPGFDPETDTAHVALRLVDRDYVPSRFLTAYGGEVASFASDDIAIGGGGDCVRNFDLADIPDGYRDGAVPRAQWAAMVQMFQTVRRAAQLADRLEVALDYQLPLRVVGFCGALGCPAYAAATATTRSHAVRKVVRPTIYFGDSASALDDGNWPDNREYHEYGHYFLADAFGDALPADPGARSHGGYNANRSSNDAWVEGFAMFYAMMVAKHVDGAAAPHIYRLWGRGLDLELDYRAWTLGGAFEDAAVAGLLLDLEDGPGDYSTAGRDGLRLRVEWSAPYDGDPGSPLLVGSVINDTVDRASARTLVVAELRRGGEVVHTTATLTIPWDLAPGGGRGAFAMSVPPELEFDDVAVTAYEGRAGDAVGDDDPIDLELGELWKAIATYRGRRSQGNGHVFDVDELYRAMRESFGGRDADSDGVDDVDQVFVAHGFFADADGDRTWKPGDRVGPTSHPGMDARPNTPNRTAELIAVDTGDADAAIYVHVALAEPHARHGYGYAVRRDEQGRVPVSMPPRQYRATATVIALADGRLPAVAARIDSEDYWAKVDAAPGEAVLAPASVELKTGTIEPAQAGRRTLGIALLVSGLVVALCGIVMLAVRRGRAVLAGAGGALLALGVGTGGFGVFLIGRAPDAFHVDLPSVSAPPAYDDTGHDHALDVGALDLEP